MTETDDIVATLPSDWTAGTRHALKSCARGELSPNVALAQIAIAGADAASAELALQTAIGRCAGRGARMETDRLRQALALLHRGPQALSTINAIASDHDSPPGLEDDPVAHWAGVFDRACARSAEASVALYSLGRSDLLAAATQEIIAWLDRAGLIGREHRVLDLGCGIGRVLEALAPRVRLAVGADISLGMAEAACGRTASLANVAVLRTSGRDLAAFGDASFDLVLAIDVFPYLVAASDDLAARHIADARRVLRPDGVLIILNYSYRGSLDRDRHDVAQLAAVHGFVVRTSEACGFRLWDAVGFELRRAA